jgi:hypothetical protein
MRRLAAAWEGTQAMGTRLDLRTTAIAACGVSGGVHAALLAVHVGSDPVLAASFGTAALLLSLAALLLAFRPELREGPALAGALFAGTLVAYLVLQADPVDFVVVVSKGVEAVGLVASLLLLRPRAAVAAPGVIVIFLLCAAFGVMVGGGHAHG